MSKLARYRPPNPGDLLYKAIVVCSTGFRVFISSYLEQFQNSLDTEVPWPFQHMFRPIIIYLFIYF